VTAEIQFLTAPAAVAFEASLAAEGDKLIAASKPGATFPTRWIILASVLERHLASLQSIAYTRFDTIRSLWTYQSGTSKVYVRI
jgi:hypothetical protein